MLHRKLAQAPTQRLQLWAANPISPSRCQWCAPKDKVNWQSEQWPSCHGKKIKRCLQQSAQESAFEQGPYYGNCSNRLHSDQNGMSNQDEKGSNPQTDKKKKVVHAHKHARIFREQPGYFLIHNKNVHLWQISQISCKISCRLGFTTNFKSKESTHSKTGNASVCIESTHDALLQTCCPNISSRLTFLPVLGIPPRLSCACVRDR